MGQDRRSILTAPAKVNLYLAIGARRFDGYHELATVMQALELHDTVTLEPADGLVVTCDPDIGVPPCDNLAAVAARVLGGIMDREPAIAIHIHKRIPAAGGLGGGSSDAAATLVGLGATWGLASDDPRIREAAEAVGADVPFFLEGGCALLGGRGDRIVKRLRTPSLHLTLVNPGVPVPTGAAYAAFDRMLAATPVTPDAILAAIDQGDAAAIAAALHNDLTEPVLGLAPEVRDALAWLGSLPRVLAGAMTGSGASVFGVFEAADAAEQAAAAAGRRGWWAVATGTRQAGVAFADGAEGDS